MEMGLALVWPCSMSSWSVANETCLGWYDSVYDEELGSQPCVFTSVTPVQNPTFYVANANFIYSPGMEQHQPHPLG